MNQGIVLGYIITGVLIQEINKECIDFFESKKL
jgi:hypothetical protein